MPTTNLSRAYGTAVERLLFHVDKNGPLWNGSPCWVWPGSKNKGYGQIQADKGTDTRRPIATHVLMWEHLRGPVPEGLQLDHLCRNRACCNPDHLEPVTSGENTVRGNHPMVVLHRANLCMNGHPLTPDNVYVNPRGTRRCRICRRESFNLWKQNRRRLRARGDAP